MTRTSSSDEDLLLEWCRLQGVALKGVKLDGRRLIATHDLAVGHCAISVPRAAVLSTDQAMASDVGQRILAQPDLLVVQDIERQRRLWLAGARHLDLARAVTRRSVLYAYLIHLRARGGQWGAYVDALPKSYGSPFTWEPRHLGSDLRDDVSRWRQHLDGQYAVLFPALSVAEPAMFPAEVFTREAWMWAHLSYETRCFPKDGGGVTAAGAGGRGEVSDADACVDEDEDEDEDEDGVLVPLVDMLNHDHGRCQMGWASGAKAVAGEWRMCVHVAVSRGDELLYSYGCKPNAKLLWVCVSAFARRAHSRGGSASPSSGPERAVPRAPCRMRSTASRSSTTPPRPCRCVPRGSAPCCGARRPGAWPRRGTPRSRRFSCCWTRTARGAVGRRCADCGRAWRRCSNLKTAGCACRTRRRCPRRSSRLPAPRT